MGSAPSNQDTIGVVPIRPGSANAGFGAEVTGIDLRIVDDTGLAVIEQAWIAHQFLLFRGQALGDPDLIAFSRRFGALDHAPVQENGRRFVPGLPEIYIVSNVIEDKMAVGSLGAGEAAWHSDMSYLPAPPKASILYALEIPASGGNTSFCDMYAAFDALPDGLRARAIGRRVKHDGTYNSGGYVRLGVTPTDDPRHAPGALHPLVCTHPESGRRVLYLGRRRMVRGAPGRTLGLRYRILAVLYASLASRRLCSLGQYRHRS